MHFDAELIERLEGKVQTLEASHTSHSYTRLKPGVVETHCSPLVSSLGSI